MNVTARPDSSTRWPWTSQPMSPPRLETCRARKLFLPNLFAQ